MPTDHPDSEEILLFVRGQSRPASTRRIVRHLLTGCLSCQKIAGRAWAPRRGPRRPDPARGPGSVTEHPGRYREACREALEALPDFAQEAEADRRAGPGLFEELLGASAPERLKLTWTDPRFASYRLAELLLEGNRQHLADDSPRALELAELAVAVSGRLDPAQVGPSARLDVEARSWSALGDARRACGDLPAAERAMAVAEGLFTDGSRDPLERAEILTAQARLRRDQGRLQEARDLLDRCIALYRRHGAASDLALALLRRGRVAAEAGELEDAVRVLHQGLAMLGERGKLRLRLKALDGLIGCCVELGRTREARRYLHRARELIATLDDPAIAARLLWQQGRVAVARKRHQEAEAAFLDSHQRLLEQGRGADAGLLTLELAHLYADDREEEKIRSLATKQVDEDPAWFQARLTLDVSTALYLFSRAARSHRASPGLVHQLARYLARRQERLAWVP